MGGFVRWTKVTHPGVRAILPAEGQQISVEFGNRLSAWCANPGQSPAASAKAPVDPALKALRKEFFALLPVDCRTNAARANQWCHDELIIEDAMALETMSGADYTAALVTLRRKVGK